ncbi:MAG: hypothetical protein JOZ84_02725 [Methylobacteriaceae bacterium]|nr:hypothetical protein [Methylobacteriaceae bacterium]
MRTLRTLIALAAPAIAGALLMTTPSAAAPFSPARPEAAPLTTQIQYGYGERREEYRERDYDRDRWHDDRRRWRDDDRDDWRRRERRRVFCRMHPEECDRY